MLKTISTIALMALSTCIYANDKTAITRAVLDYIESQHHVKPALMDRGLDKKLAKRTYWQKADGEAFIMETNHSTMMKVASTYNINGDKFPDDPQVDIEIFDMDQRVASVKLTADDWIDYMHLYKDANDQWKIINVLWQYKDINKHKSKK